MNTVKDKEHRDSRNRLVLLALYRRARGRNPWVSTAELATETIGGTGARTRVSNLRQQGHQIESRRKDGCHQFEYRYVGPPLIDEPGEPPRRARKPRKRGIETIPLF